MRLAYTISQAFKQMNRNKAMTFASIFAITAMLLILGLFFILIVNVNMAAESIRDDYDTIEVFYLDKTSVQDIQKAQAEVVKWDNVEKVDFRSKEQAMEILKKRWGDSGYLLDSLKNNPLPNSLIITVKDLEESDKVAEQARALAGIEDIRYYKDTVDKLVRITNGMQIAALVIIGFLVIISIVVVSNTIKLTVLNRAEEISIMKYVGATNWFIRGPFLFEGIWIGGISAGLAAGIVAAAYWKASDLLGDGIMQALSMPMVPVKFMSLNLLWIFLALGISIGAWGSIISMRRFLDT